MSETLTATDGQTKTYRGESIEGLLPLVRAELGPEAVIVRRREGLVGGIGGFFQKRCVEVDAQAGGPRIDVYDDGGTATGEEPIVEGIAKSAVPAEPVAVAEPPEPHPVRNDVATREGLATPAMRQIVGEAKPFADLLDQMATEPEAVPETPTAEPERPEPRRVATLREGMVATGLGPDLTAELVDATLAYRAPFAASGRLRTLVRDELAARLPIAGPATGRRTVALVGPAGAGKTAATARLAAAHAGAGQTVACFAVAPADDGAALRALLGDDAGIAVEVVAAGDLAAALHATTADLVLVDTPPVSAADAAAVAALAGAFAGAGVDEVHLALRAGTGAGAGGELLEALRPLGPNRLLLTGAAETRHLGGALDLAIRAALPLSYVAPNAAELAPADPRALASMVMP